MAEQISTDLFRSHTYRVDNTTIFILFVCTVNLIHFVRTKRISLAITNETLLMKVVTLQK